MVDSDKERYPVLTFGLHGCTYLCIHIHAPHRHTHTSKQLRNGWSWASGLRFPGVGYDNLGSWYFLFLRGVCSWSLAICFSEMSTKWIVTSKVSFFGNMNLSILMGKRTKMVPSGLRLMNNFLWSGVGTQHELWIRRSIPYPESLLWLQRRIQHFMF